MYQNVVQTKALQIDKNPLLKTSIQVIRNRTLDQAHQSQPILGVEYNFETLQQLTNWKYTYPVNSVPVIDYTTLSLSRFPFQSSTASRSGTLLNPSIFKFWLQQRNNNRGPLSDVGLSYDSVSRNKGFFLKSYNKSGFMDSMLQYYSQNEIVNFNVINLLNYRTSNGFVLNNKQFEPKSYQHMTFVYRFYLRSINERFVGKQNIFTSTLPPQSYFDSNSLVTYIQPLSIWLQDADLYINFATQFQRQKNYISRIKIPNVDSVFKKQLLNTIIVTYSIGQPIFVYINGIKYTPIVFQTGQAQDGQPYQVLLFYKSTIGQYRYLGVCQTSFSMSRQQISAYTYLFGNRPMQLINTVDKYYQFKTIQNDINAKQSRTHFGKWYNEFVIAQNDDNVIVRDVFKHSFKDLIMISRPLSQTQIDTLFGVSPISLLSNFDVGPNADIILLLDEVVAVTNTSQTIGSIRGAVWNQLNFLYNSAQFNQGGFVSPSQTNQNTWVFYQMIYDKYRNCILNYQSNNMLKNIRFSVANIRYAEVTDIGYVSKKNGLIIITGDIFKINGFILDYMLIGTYYTDILRQRNIYKKTYLCQTTDTYLDTLPGTKYITKIGLYNRKNQLLAVGSVNKPLIFDQNSKVKLKVKIEF